MILATCDHCHGDFPAESMYFGPEPFLEDVWDKFEPVTLCEECRIKSVFET